MKCKNCGKELGYFSRPNQKTCSDVCRKAVSRRKENIKRDGERLMMAIAVLAQHMKHEDLQDLVRGYMFKAEKRLDELQTVTAAAVTEKSTEV